MPYSSRLERRFERESKRRVYLLIGGSILFLLAFFYFGFPQLFNLANTISGLRPRTQQVVRDIGLPPAAPRLSQDYVATRSAQIKVAGVADAKITVELFQNNRSLGTQITDKDGKFSFDVTLDQGENNFQAQANSDNGKKSDLSEVYKVNYLTGQPKLEGLNISDSDSVKDNPLLISGKTDPENTVTVNDHFAFITGNGSFSYSLNLNNEDNKIKVVVTDRAGNQTVKELTVKYSP